MVHSRDILDRLSYSVHCRNVLLVVELLNKLVHRSYNLLVAELGILCQVIEPEVYSGLQILSYE
jgi:hypothetical protein